MNKVTINQKTFFSSTAGGATVFFASACVMMLELAAGRLVAQHLGSSLYTWTTVIGVTLAGLTMGNYAGGRIADYSTEKRTIAGLFGIASITCIGSIYLSNNIERWMFYWQLSWPEYVFAYITLLFLLPPVFISAVIPPVAKITLDHQQKTGQTIGSIYAYGAAGSIAGTFIAGFWLIPAIGSNGLIWATSAALLVVGLLYSPRYRLLQLWGGMLVLMVFMGTSRNQKLEEAGAMLSLRSKPDPNCIYEEETRYCHIRVRKVSDQPEKRIFFQDRLSHSKIIMNNITDFQYEYVRIYAAATEQILQNRNNPTFLAIGGGGFVLPRYLKYRWPTSEVDIAEIDPGVTKAAIAAFGLQKNHGLNIFTADGRNFIDDIIAKKQAGKWTPTYDFIYGDAYDNFSVPYQLVTREFNEKVARILKKDGFYMLNLVDIYSSGLVLSSVFNTLQQTFRNIYVLAPMFDYYDRTTFVLIASMRTLDTNALVAELDKYYPDIWCLSPAETDSLKMRRGKITLTDDYAPMDNLVAPVAVQEKTSLLATAYINEAQRLSEAGQWDQALKTYMKVIRNYSPLTVKDYLSICEDLLIHREFQESLLVCQKAIQYYDKPEIRNDISTIHLGMSAALRGLGQIDEYKKYLNRAIEGFKSGLKRHPNSTEILSNLGAVLADNGNFSDGAGYLEQAVKIDPSNPTYRFMLAEALIGQKDYAGAQAAITDAIEAMKRAGNEEAVSQLQQLLEQVTYQKLQTKQ